MPRPIRIRGAAGAVLVATVVAAAPTAAVADPPPPREHITPSRVYDQRIGCPRGFELRELGTARCYRTCRTRFALLVDRGARGHCIPRRVTRLWYRVELEAVWQRVQRGVVLPSVTATEDHAWRFRSNGAIVLFRQCTPPVGALPPSDLRVLGDLDPAISCARQGRTHGFPIVEDASFGSRGTIVGGAYTYREDGWPPSTTMYWYDRRGVAHSQPCSGTPTTTGTGSGPTRLTAQLGTGGRSALVGGMSISRRGTPQDRPGSQAFTTDGVTCPIPLDIGASPPTYHPYTPTPPGQRELQLTEAHGSELVSRFMPRLGPAFGRPRIVAGTTVTDTSGSSVRTATFTLTLTRCPHRAGRTPRGC